MKRYLTIVGIIAGVHFILSFTFCVFVRFEWASGRTLSLFGRLLFPIELSFLPKSFPEGIILEFIINSALWGVGLSTLIYAVRSVFRRREA
jgi:hypothetical protein